MVRSERQAIVVSCKGNVVTARAQCGKVRVAYNDSVSYDRNREIAARVFMVKWGWHEHSRIIGSGGLPNGDQVYVLGQKGKGRV